MTGFRDSPASPIYTYETDEPKTEDCGKSSSSTQPTHWVPVNKASSEPIGASKKRSRRRRNRVTVGKARFEALLALQKNHFDLVKSLGDTLKKTRKAHNNKAFVHIASDDTSSF